MNEKKKYSMVTNSDIEEGLKNHRFQKEDISLIRDKEGRVVKHLPITNARCNVFPSSLIQINSTYIYQTDILPIINAIIETRNVEIFQDLSEKHQAVIDSLTYYKDHKSRLDELNSISLNASSVFEKRVEAYLNDIDAKNLEKTDVKVCVSIIDSYLNIIFIYLISTYWLHEKNISNDTIANRKIKNLYQQVRRVYEQLLAYSVQGANGPIITMDDSIYAKYLLADEVGLKKIERLIKHDSRFSSAINLMEFVHKYHIQKIKSHWDDDVQRLIPERYFILMRLNEDRKLTDNKIEFIDEIFNILEKIKILENVNSELVKAGKIDFSAIELYPGSMTNEALQLTVMPLALHGTAEAWR